MQVDFKNEKPIFAQIAEMLENAIFSGAYAEEEQIPSITELAVAHNINPATALKGINLLVDEGMLFKKRGLGMFVAKGARDRLYRKRKESFFKTYVQPMVQEAVRLEIGPDKLDDMIKRGFEEYGN